MSSPDPAKSEKHINIVKCRIIESGKHLFYRLLQIFIQNTIDSG
jgi:hypothetical protein